ncbi:MAG: O-antigen ligase family protein [Oscillospiraceae bacterium]|nr:O-antigen ligase family protein [Oscillospiraceae bacterium]
MNLKESGQLHILPRLLAVLIFTSFYALFNWAYGSFAILLMALLAAVSMLWEQSGRLHVRLSFFHIWMLLFAGYCFLSSIWAWDADNTVTKGITVLSMFICYSLLWLCYQEFDSVDCLLKAVLWGGNILMLIVIVTYGLKGILSLLQYEDRLSEQFFLNSNTVGVICAMSFVINFYYVLKEKRLHWWTVFLLLGILIVSATGSRQALAVMMGGLVLLYFLSVMHDRAPAEIAVLVLIGIALLLVLLLMIAKLPAFSGIYKRMQSMFSAMSGVGQTDRSATTRLQMIEIGMDQFYRTPLLGIGIGSARYAMWKYMNRLIYLHNNFVEILAGGGVVGFAIYYSVFVWILINFIRYHRYGTVETSVCAALLIMLLVDDYANVTYYSKDTYFYLMICALEVEKLRSNCREHLPKTPLLRSLPGGVL